VSCFFIKRYFNWYYFLSGIILFLEVTTSPTGGLEERALVMFEDESISIVPRRKILDFDMTIHERCTVKWTNGKKYAAELLFLGKFK